MKSSTDERVLQLERKLMGLQHEVQSAQAREAMSTGRLQTRLAQVASGASGSDNTFPVIFQDGTYPESVGSHTPTYSPRQTTSRAVVHNVANSLPPVGTVLLCSWWGDRWWCDWSTSGSEGGGGQIVGTNILYSPNWHYYGGANDLDFASNAPLIHCVDSVGHATYLATFQLKTGPDIGVILNPTSPLNNITLSQPGFYSFDFRCDVLQMFYLPSSGYTLPTREWWYSGYIEMAPGTASSRLPILPGQWPIFEANMSTEHHHADGISTESPGEIYTLQPGSVRNAHGHYHDSYSVGTGNIYFIVGRGVTQYNLDPSGTNPIPEFGCGFNFTSLKITRYA